MQTNLQTIENLFLCKSGDIFSTFIEAIVDSQNLTLISNSEVFLNNTFQRICNDRLKESDLNYNLVTYEKNSRYDIKYSVLNIDNAIKIDYKVNEPVSFFLDKSVISKYDIIHKFLLKMIIFQYVLSKTFTELKVDKRSFSAKEMRITKLFHKIYNVIKSFHTFVIDNVIHKIWDEFYKQAAISVDIEDLKRSHNEALDKIIEALSEDKNVNISYGIIVIINKLFLKTCQFYLRVSSESIRTYLSIKDEEFLLITNKLEVYLKRLEDSISEESILGKLGKIKSYIFNSYYY